MCEIRKAIITDLDQIEKGYQEHFLYEKENGAYTVFKEGVYPTRKDAQKALSNNSLYVYDDNGVIAGSIIIDRKQPDEYKKIEAFQNVSEDRVMVVHLLMVRPSMKGKGIASSLINYAVQMAEKCSCEVLRLDTGSQNIPALSLYKKSGFKIIASAPKKVGNVIAHDNHLFLERTI